MVAGHLEQADSAAGSVQSSSSSSSSSSCGSSDSCVDGRDVFGRVILHSWQLHCPASLNAVSLVDYHK
eukprot:6364007-Karenia_brevis.AAC.1